MSNFFEMGSSHIQPAWESNNNNKKVEEGRGLVTAARVRGGRPAGVGGLPPPGAWAGHRQSGRVGAKAAAPATCVALDLARTRGRGLGGPFLCVLRNLSKELQEALPGRRGAPLAPSGGRAMC